VTVGGGVRYIGESWDGADKIRTPDYTLFDAMIRYENRAVALSGQRQQSCRQAPCHYVPRPWRLLLRDRSHRAG
jgi:thiamine biosynthesis lipoprotein ApbE